MKNLLQSSFLNALGTVAYVALVATIMNNAERVLGHMNKITGPIAFLMLFVVSASVTGSLVLGKPILTYLDGQKSEAVRLFIYTICWLALATVLLLLANLVV